ncbi:copper chaperone PCu(A)C [Demequina zhanjiangensis]|uniref:Copper chaperone PCu(A)C n=1 Tax=Demequina zhanjiangensis TaxID=3051659 RepID=A0ABT8FZM1_9MICO|nr:copper chaperone PCu(A)C [Demequina sp. SYSU T00b26]MDN4472307.1 copper chaperone PCu(A)C [Demequina sp. SYSU T00b26]
MKKSLIALAATAALALTACSTDTETGSDGTDAAASLTVADAWVKAVDDGMTGAFALITNGTGDDLTITGATTDAASMVELHETVMDDAGATVMQEVDGGFTVGAGETFTLEPGGNHLMLMGVTAPLEPGAEVSMTLELADGSTVPFTAVVKEFTGAQESYAPESEDMDMSPSASADLDGS